ncbi:MAG TPA: YceI family protein [Thermoanaerobaculia bacterium]|nr:YceI family protein [Thermoanaerobaculia bacterium]
MKGRILAQALSLTLLLPVFAAAEPITYKADKAHSGVSFSVRHFVTNVQGRFKDFDGVIKYDPQSPAASSVQFTVKAASVDTGNNDRDEHLRSDAFFNVEKNPTWNFVSSKVVAKDKTHMDVTGDLTMNGVTKTITVPVEYLGSVKTPRGDKAGFETSFTVNRKEYGINYNQMIEAGSVIGDDVKVTLTIEANRDAGTPPAAAAPKPGR